MKILPGRLASFVVVCFGALGLASVSGYKAESDREVAVKYCSSCHLFPEPQLLDKNTWMDSVLPNMTWRLGIGNSKSNPFEGMDQGEINLIKALNVFPETRSIGEEDWSKVVRFYEKSAPLKPLIQDNSILVEENLPFFDVMGVKLKNQQLPQITMLKYDDDKQELYVGDALNELVALDQEFTVKEVWKTESPTVDMVFADNGPSVLTIGSILPSEKKKGNLTALQNSSEKNLRLLKRPTQVLEADLNQDQEKDWIVSEFGNHLGQLVWFESGDGRKRHILKSQAGARKVEIADLNIDGKPDIVGMFAQAQEEIVIFYNKGKGDFSEKTVLKFHPAFGLSYFELVDFNADGALDIVVSNGDNWDLSKIDKNYHGIRVYFNDKKDNFKEAFFFPLYGASKVLSHDFDGDGDLDLAAVSFYSDNEHGFVYLQNQGDLSFKAYSSPAFKTGKWLTMEKLDYDQDGDLDLILGTYFHNALERGKLMVQGAETFPELLLLKNKWK